VSEYVSITPIIKARRFCDALERDDKEQYRALVDEISRREQKKNGPPIKREGLFG